MCAGRSRFGAARTPIAVPSPKSITAQRALGGESVAMKDLAHQRGAEHLVEIGAAAGIALAVVAGLHRAVGDLRAGD